ncbi:MAG: 23S rRNA (pseudouridine(1915)-N(3))-methyltransferase RlmH [Schleiferiaceae bacterium]|nr:23S rRNA (pseudouridine(1915)-N(3))-methyltransferase RlmH [Flavobacteriales bacterium]MDG1006547.1 23S rRNA (pseudouridine(1915)-N(3))-methyltransferase RlmH [Schleiferiaceae bacterium]MDG1220231.1 23S rRNA (pseudouridine(1915)-N(3))-methyltransferase RlmH [Schleiferiaceae bacterium]MDG1758490.1 23S rRNA (pseudouridine(1915)-N(3))-methyltransferase RlmH [Schleiferiaceae bacterium]MDG2225946.1 23S rRNA (pseudouridine(1915)-N(3))-methyltransferase RlmH [Schleiferiaceae bacterium]
MEIVMLVIGKTGDALIQQGMDTYLSRLQRYVKTSLKVVSSRDAQLKYLKPGDTLVLLDEKGALHDSVKLAGQMQKWMNAGPKRLVFAVGDAYGFSPEFRAMAAATLGLSPLTFTHDMVRLIFLEQCYRCMTILHNEPYHHR